jgi:hypothetical protein
MFFDRTTARKSRMTSRVKVFPAPKKGWIRNEAFAAPTGMGAEVLDNWFPTPEGIRMRRGSIKRATCDTTKATTHLTTYEAGATLKMFATDANNIYNVSPADVADPDVALTAAVTGLTSGDWSSVQFQAGGGTHLVMVNGTDDMYRYNGTQWLPVDDVDIYSLAYDAESAPFTVGQTLTGGTSGATATIERVTDNGTTGTLWLSAVTSGPFQDNETITDSATGSATANGASSLLIAKITGVDTSDLEFVWSFKNRLFFIEGGTLSAWCLPVLSIAGTASKIDLGGVFKYGGALMFGGTYSRDAGSGLDDFCVFVTDNGEIAVYQGSDPTDADAWSLVGVYKVGRPLGKNAFFKAGGDLGIATDDGIVSVAQALASDRAGQQPITYPIEEAWRAIVNERGFAGYPFQTVLWHKQTMLFVVIPAFSGLVSYCLVANSKTGAWARYTDWDTRCAVVFQDKLYFGTSTGTIIEAETGGADQDAPYAAVAIPRFDMLGSANEKVAMHVRIVARTNRIFSVQAFAAADYVYDIPAPLAADTDIDDDTWGSGIWGSSVWGGVTDTKDAISEWQGVSAVGHALSPGFQVASGRDTEPDMELISMHLLYQEGGIVV